jgi:hypothetical protein
MPTIRIYGARIDGQGLSGIVYGFQEILPALQPFHIIPLGTMDIDAPEGYVLETVHSPSPYGDGITGELMLFDPDLTSRSTSGRVYMRAARAMRRNELGDFKEN